VLSNPPVIGAPLAEEEYGPKAIPPAPPPQPVGIPEATDPARQVAKEGNGAAAGIAADTGIYSYDLVKPGDEDDGEDKAAVAKAELAAFRRFRQARRKAGAWRDFEFRAVDPETARELNDAGRAAVRKAASGYTVSPRSGMISLDVPDGLISPLPGGGTDFHVTVAYLGADVGDDLLVQALTAARDAAATVPGPLDGTLSGISSFPPGDGSDGKVPAFIPVQLPGAEPLRAALEYLSASDHPGWTPHVTVAYLEPGDALPGPLPPTPVTFTHLSVHRGGEVTRFPLGPGTPPASDCCGAECCADGCCNGAAGCQCAPAEVAKAGGNPKDWAGWRLADKAAAYWAPLILAAVSGALTPAALSRIAAAYLDAFPDQQGDAPGKRDRNDAAYGWLTAWLAAAGITLDLAAQAAGILTDGYLIGSVSAAAMIDGTGADLGAWKPGDSGAASDRIAALGGEDALAALLGQSGAAATAGMTAAFLGAISRALAGSDGDADAATLAAALAAVAADRDLATGAALDELYASAGTAALDYYPGHYDGDFQWVVDPTLSNCAICLDNAAADPRPLGEPWPSGDTGVNIHKGCGCALCPS
jgi:2'-5' RNA ligase